MHLSIVQKETHSRGNNEKSGTLAGAGPPPALGAHPKRGGELDADGEVAADPQAEEAHGGGQVGGHREHRGGGVDPAEGEHVWLSGTGGGARCAQEASSTPPPSPKAVSPILIQKSSF